MSVETKNIQAFILAGGQSSRMGQDKGLLMWQGKSFVEHILAVVQPWCEHVILISNEANKYEKFGCEILQDAVRDIGPLGGIYTGLKHSDKKMNLFLTCDSPTLSLSFFQHFLSEACEEEINYSRIGEKIHPLPVLLPKDVLSNLEQCIQHQDYKLLYFYQQFSNHVIDMSSFEKEMFNINTPEEYNSLISLQ
jgi:molybdopterin-guanine dinucleotide biosynthesis protein A